MKDTATIAAAAAVTAAPAPVATLNESAADATPAKRQCPTTTPPVLTQTDPALRVQLVHEKAVLPHRGSPKSAGYDISACEQCVVPARGRAVVKTGLRVAIPEGYYGRVAPRSGLAVKKFIDTGAGVIDADYRGDVGVVLFNFSDVDFKVEVGDRVAQLVIEKISMGNIFKVDSLDATERGAGGFGSTGVAA